MTSLSDHLLRLPTDAEPPADAWARLAARLDAEARTATLAGRERPPARDAGPLATARPATAVWTRRAHGRRALGGIGQALAALAFCGVLTGTGAWAGGQAGERALRQQAATYARTSARLEQQVQAGPAALVAVADTRSADRADAEPAHPIPAVAVAGLAEDGSEPLSAYWVRDEIAAIDARLARHPSPAAAAALWRSRNDLLETWLALADPNPSGAAIDT